MKKSYRFLVLLLSLTLLMSFGLAATAFATDFEVDNSTGNWEVNNPTPSTPSTSSNIEITFLHGDEFTMEAQPGTTKLSDGSVLARTGKGLLNENLIPESTGVDQYYAVTDWAIKDGEELIIIDFETYRFEKDTELYAIVKDS